MAEIMENDSKNKTANCLLTDALYRGRNNYDLIRLLLATAVVFGHSFSISRNDDFKEPVLAFLQFDYIGNLAVYGFFLISGLFVTESYLKKSSIRKFITSRFLRIFPGLFVCLFVSAYVIGVLSTKWSLVSYLSSPEVSGYVISGMNLYRPQWELPGVFEGNSIRGVNGSIWTLVGEVFCYFCILVLGFFRIFRVRELAIFVTIFTFCIVAFSYPRIIYFSGVAGFKLPFIFFIAGALCAVLKDKFQIRLSILLLLIAAAGMARFINLEMFKWCFYVFFAYGIIYFGQSSIAKRFRIHNDISYGVYLYGFPLQQLLEYWVPQHNPWLNFLLSMPMIICISYLSWHFVEQPMIKLSTQVNNFTRGGK